MRKRFAALVAFAALALGLLIAPSPAGAVADNGTGHFWLHSGLNQTGEYRDFNIGPDQVYNFGALRYQQNCSGTCDFLKDTVSSITFSCGVSGSPIDDNDTLTFYDIYPNIGISQLVNPSYPSQCSNGVIKVNLGTLNNRADSVITNE